MTSQQITRRINCISNNVGIAARVTLENMVIKSQSDNEYKIELHKWIEGETSTVALRELCRPVIGWYFDNLRTANIVDDLDSAQCK